MKPFFTILLFLICISFQAQVSFLGYLVDEDNAKMKNVTVNLYQGNDKISTKIWSKKFEYDLELDKYYTLELIKDGFETKRIAISTFEGDKGAEPFLFVMELKEAKKGEEPDDFPSALIEYKKDEGSFSFDVKYAKDVKKKSK